MLKVTIDKIKLKHVSFQKTLLQNINFELNRNKVYTILGKNGAGKTTLINSILLLLNKRDYETNARVIFEGADLYKISDADLRNVRKNKIKLVFQDAQKSFDQLKKIGYYFNELNYESSKLDELLNFFKLPDQSKILSLHPYELSVGMAQRVSFILALIADPKIIILDEPTSAVDAIAANLFLLKISEFVNQPEKLVLIITQDLLFAEKVSDKIAYISEGRLTEFISSSKFFSVNHINEINELVESYRLLNS